MSNTTNHPAPHTTTTAGPSTTATGSAGGLWSVPGTGTARIKVGSDPETIRVLTEALDRGELPGVYVQDGAPVVLQHVSGATSNDQAGDEDAPVPLRVSELNPARLAGLLAKQATVYRSRSDRAGHEWDEEVTPPQSVLNAVLAAPTWPGLPVLRAVIGAPVLRRDGTLLQAPGYDTATGYYLAPRTRLTPVPDHPTPAQVTAAREFLLGAFLGDFPWRTPADRANYLAVLATPLLRPFLRCLTPFVVVDATMPGSGKTILTSCVGLLVGQRVLTWPDGSDEELRKAITSVLADAGGVVVFDNLIEGTIIDSAVLARLVTERCWTDRRLGTNQAASFPNDRLWLATGNNLRTGGDMASRAVWVRLDPDCPRPEARTGFAIPNLDSWILHPDNQATVLHHLLVLVLDWTANGAPVDHHVPAMRQFTTWARALGGFLAHHHVPGFLANAEDSRDLDDTAAEWAAFLTRWHTLHGPKPLTAAELRASADYPADLGASDPWDGTFPTTTTGRLPSAKSLGRQLTGQLGRWRNTTVLRSVTDTHTNARRYWVEHRPDPPKQTRKPANPPKPTPTSNNS